MTTALSLLFGLLLVFGFAAGFLLSEYRVRKSRGRKAASLVREGEALLRSDNPLTALQRLCESMGLIEDHIAASLIGTALETLGNSAEAAASYRRAVALAYGDPFRKSVATRGFVPYYAWLESSAWASAGHWDWAFDASGRWLPALDEGRLVCEFGGGDCLQRLRAVHMVASLNHLRNNEAWERAAADANAILAAATDSEEARLAQAILEMRGVTVDILNAEIEEYLRRN